MPPQHGVAHDDDVLDANVEHGEFERRADAVVLAVGLVGRHEVRDVAHGEQLARHGAEHRLGLDAALPAARRSLPRGSGPGSQVAP